MPVRQQILVIGMSLGLFIFIIQAVKNRKLREEYSWLWLLTGAVILLLSSWHNLLRHFTHLIGVANNTSTVFFFGLMFLMFISLHASMKISRLTAHQKNLTQEIALLRFRLQELGKDEAADSAKEEE